MNEQPELFDGDSLRDTGIHKVLGNNEAWYDQCFHEAARWIAKQYKDFTGEDVRFHCSETVGLPQHPNAWGGLSNHLVREKIMRPTGRMRKPRDGTSHARAIQVYVRCDRAYLYL